MRTARHIAIVNVSGPAHVNPTLSIVSTLVKRGYRVTYVTSHEYAEEITALGAQVLLCPSVRFPYTESSADTLPMAQQYVKDDFELASRTVAAVLPYYAANVPDLILHDAGAFAGHILSGKLRVPAIRFTASMAYDHENVNHPTVREQFRESVFTASRLVDELLSRHGLKSRGAMFLGENPVIRLYERSLQFSPHAGAEHCLYAARCGVERRMPLSWMHRHSNPTIVVATSTTHLRGVSYYQMCIEALTGLPYDVVLAVGGSFDAAQLGSLPPGFKVISTPVAALMPGAEMIICMSGVATTMEAMYHGLPMLMMTHGIAQMEGYASNVEEHGLGVHLRGSDTSVFSIHRHVVEMLRDSQLRTRVVRMQRLVKRSAGAEEVVNWLEDHLDGIRSVPVIQ